jgi:hypothetical protein
LVFSRSRALGRPAAHLIQAAARRQDRTYYIAADEVEWDFAPTGTDHIHGEKYHLQVLATCQAISRAGMRTRFQMLARSEGRSRRIIDEKHVRHGHEWAWG